MRNLMIINLDIYMEVFTFIISAWINVYIKTNSSLVSCMNTSFNLELWRSLNCAFEFVKGSNKMHLIPIHWTHTVVFSRYEWLHPNCPVFFICGVRSTKLKKEKDYLGENAKFCTHSIKTPKNISWLLGTFACTINKI